MDPYSKIEEVYIMSFFIGLIIGVVVGITVTVLYALCAANKINNEDKE